MGRGRAGTEVLLFFPEQIESPSPSLQASSSTLFVPLQPRGPQGAWASALAWSSGEAKQCRQWWKREAGQAQQSLPINPALTRTCLDLPPSLPSSNPTRPSFFNPHLRIFLRLFLDPLLSIPFAQSFLSSDPQVFVNNNKHPLPYSQLPHISTVLKSSSDSLLALTLFYRYLPTISSPSLLPFLSALRSPVLPRCIFLCVFRNPSVFVNNTNNAMARSFVCDSAWKLRL